MTTDLYPIVNKLIKEDGITPEELSVLIVEYIKEEKGKEPTSEELKEIIHAFSMGILSSNYMISIMLAKPHIYKMYLVTVYNKEGKRIKQTLYRN